MKNYTLRRIKTQKITKNRVYSLNLNTEHPRFQKLVLLVQQREIDSGKKLSIWIASEDQTSCFTENIDDETLHRTNKGFNNWEILYINFNVTFDNNNKTMLVWFPSIMYFRDTEFNNFGLMLCKILSDNCVYFACANQYRLAYSHIDHLISNELWLHLNDKGLKVDFNRQIHGHPTNGYLMEDDSFDFFGKIFILMKV